MIGTLAGLRLKSWRGNTEDGGYARVGGGWVLGKSRSGSVAYGGSGWVGARGRRRMVEGG